MSQIANRATAETQGALLLELVAQLEVKLEEVDAMGAHIAAAHLDVAIDRLKRMAHSD